MKELLKAYFQKYGTLRNAIKLIIIVCLSLVFLIVYMYMKVVVFPPDYIKKEAIINSISSEVPIYYDDEKSIAGTFFSDSHRRYVKITDAPKMFLDAVIAAEDKDFYKHRGINPRGILRAMLANIMALRVVQGGSTITQQTAENIFHIHGRTIRAKFLELIDTFRLEYYYTKEEILEFYINQFYVNSNGRGLGIASKYFFNKEPYQLSLSECAFIAGALKGPNRYNPYFYREKELQDKAYERAMRRKAYVLENMFDLGFINKEQFDKAINEKITFNIGTFSFQSNVIVDMTRNELRRDLKDIVGEEAIKNITTSGLKIYTTINKDLEEQTLYHMRKNLSKLDITLNGYKKITKPREYEILFPPTTPLARYEFYPAQITKVEFERNIKKINPKKMAIHIDIYGEEAKIPYDGIKQLVDITIRNKKGYYAGSDDKDILAFLSSLEKESYLLVSIRGFEKEVPIADIEQLPLVNGGGIILQDGMIKAIVGGFTNRDYNRAIQAKRQPGSIFKVILYTAAESLGWHNLDPLDNTRNVFPYFETYYFPRPDHTDAPETVSLIWAGAQSENLASIYLLYHLLDQLNFSQFETLCKYVNLSPATMGKNEFVELIQGKYGISMTRDKLLIYPFSEIKNDQIADLTFDGKYIQAKSLKKMNYGYGFDTELERLTDEVKELERQLQTETNEAKVRKIRVSIDEDRVKIVLAENNFLRIEKLSKELEAILEELTSGNYTSQVLDNFYLKLYKNGTKMILFIPDERLAYFKAYEVRSHEGSEDEEREFDYIKLDRYLAEKLMSADSKEELEDKVLIDGKISIDTVRALRTKLDEKYVMLKDKVSVDLPTLFYQQDFRVLLGLRYITKLGHLLGIRTKLDEVLSFPLGSNSVSLLELATVFQTLATGSVFIKPLSDDPYATRNSIIKKITDVHGKVIYERLTDEKKIVPAELSYLISSILNNVIKYGTGRLIDSTLFLSVTDSKNESPVTNYHIKIPAFGKTGTTNDYTNSSFIGFIPVYEENIGLDIRHAYVMSMYVGYDDNREMKNDVLRIAGATGALPIWRDVAQKIVLHEKLEKNIDFADLVFQSSRYLPLYKPHFIAYASIDKDTGLIRGSGCYEDIPSEQDEDTIFVRILAEAGEPCEPKRLFVPFRF